jgi:hypothetical protein
LNYSPLVERSPALMVISVLCERSALLFVSAVAFSLFSITAEVTFDCMLMVTEVESGLSCESISTESVVGLNLVPLRS